MRKKLPAAGAGPGEGAKVLLVDRNPGDLEQIAAALRGQGFRVVTLVRVEAAAPLFQAYQPDAMVVGVDAEGSSLRVARRLHRLSEGAVPLLCLTPGSDPGLRLACLTEGGAVAALDRSQVSTAELGAQLRSVLQVRAALKRSVGLAEGGVPMEDPLTGGFSEAYFLAMISHEARRSERYGGSFSVAVVDLRRFSDFKRRFGPEMAEKLVVYTSVVLNQGMREADVVARIGPRRFALLMPGAEAEMVPKLLHRVATRFRSARLELGGHVVKPSVALGAVTFPDMLGGAPQLLAEAARNLKDSEEYADVDAVEWMSAPAVSVTG